MHIDTATNLWYILFIGDETSAYCVNFQLKNEPNAYIVIGTNKTTGDCIKEFGLSGEGIYETLVENYYANGYDELSEKKEKKLFSIGSFEYAVRTENSSYYTTNNEKVSTNKIEELSHQIKTSRKSYNKELTAKKRNSIKVFYSGTALGATNFECGNLYDIENFIPSGIAMKMMVKK